MNRDRLERAGDLYLPDAGEGSHHFIQRLLETRDRIQPFSLPFFGAHNGRIMRVDANSTMDTLIYQWDNRTFA